MNKYIQSRYHVWSLYKLNHSHLYKNKIISIYSHACTCSSTYGLATNRFIPTTRSSSITFLNLSAAQPMKSTTIILSFDDSILFLFSTTRLSSVCIPLALSGMQLSTHPTTSLFFTATKALFVMFRFLPLTFCPLRLYYPLLNLYFPSASPNSWPLLSQRPQPIVGLLRLQFLLAVWSE